MLNKFLALLLICITSLFLFCRPQLQPTIEDTNSDHEIVIPVAWLEKRDERLEYWLQNSIKN